MGEPAGRVLVISPTYNERENLGELVRRLMALEEGVDLLVVDDASPDGTGELADALARGEPRVHVLHRPGKGGLASAYIAGFRWALGRDYGRIVTMDADLSHNPEDVSRLLGALARYDLVVGSRYVLGGHVRGWGLLRQGVSRGGNLYARWVLGVGVRDLTSGFKAIRRQVLEAIRLDTVQTEGYAFAVEVTYRALRCGFSVGELAIIFTDRRAGSSKMTFPIFLEAAVAMWRFRRWRPHAKQPA